MADERIKFYLDNSADDMEGALMYLDEALAHIRAGKANVRLIDNVRVDYYGTMSALTSVATVIATDARTLQIQPWEKAMLSLIEKALLCSDIGITPMNNGECIRLCIPPLTEERRRDLVKKTNAAGEEAKISVRNARRDAIDKMKKEVKNGLPEDVAKDGEAEAQKLHDKYIKRIDELMVEKEKEIMTV